MRSSVEEKAFGPFPQTHQFFRRHVEVPFALPPNATLSSGGRLSDVCLSGTRIAAAVCCSALFGVPFEQAAHHLPPMRLHPVVSERGYSPVPPPGQVELASHPDDLSPLLECTMTGRTIPCRQPLGDHIPVAQIDAPGSGSKSSSSEISAADLSSGRASAYHQVGVPPYPHWHRRIKSHKYCGEPLHPARHCLRALGASARLRRRTTPFTCRAACKDVVSRKTVMRPGQVQRLDTVHGLVGMGGNLSQIGIRDRDTQQ